MILKALECFLLVTRCLRTWNTFETHNCKFLADFIYVPFVEWLIIMLGTIKTTFTGVIMPRCLHDLTSDGHWP